MRFVALLGLAACGGSIGNRPGCGQGRYIAGTPRRAVSEPWFPKCRDHLLQRKEVNGFPQEASFRFGAFSEERGVLSVLIVAQRSNQEVVGQRVSGLD
jgi:hypothetical protein